MNVYQKAANALKDAVKASLDQDVNPNLQSEIWRHYQGMQNIATQLEEKDTFSISMDGVDSVFSYDGIGYAAADTISFYGAEGNDVISFS